MTAAFIDQNKTTIFDAKNDASFLRPKKSGKTRATVE